MTRKTESVTNVSDAGCSNEKCKINMPLKNIYMHMHIHIGSSVDLY